MSENPYESPREIPERARYPGTEDQMWEGKIAVYAFLLGVLTTELAGPVAWSVIGWVPLVAIALYSGIHTLMRSR